MHDRTFNNGDKPRPRRADKQESDTPLAPCQPGDVVTYQSSTYKTEMMTVVKRSYAIDGVQYYDLECKPRALGSNVKRRPLRYKVGDVVMYYSETHKQSMEAEVTRIYPDDPKIVDLNIKVRAMEERIRPKEAPQQPPISDADAAAGGGREKAPEEVYLVGLGKPRGGQHEKEEVEELEALPQHAPLEEAPEEPQQPDPSSPPRQTQQNVPPLQVVQPPQLGFPEIPASENLENLAPDEPPQPLELLQPQREQAQQQQQEQQQQQPQSQPQQPQLPPPQQTLQPHQHQQQAQPQPQPQPQAQPQPQQAQPQPQAQQLQHHQHQHQHIQHLPQQIRQVQQATATPPQVQQPPYLAITRQYQQPMNGEVSAGRPCSPIRMNITKTHMEGQPARTPTNFAAGDNIVSTPINACTPISGCPDPSPIRHMHRSNSSMLIKGHGGYQLKSGETLAATHEHPPIPLHQPSPGRQHAHYTSFGQAQVVNRGTTPPPRVTSQVTTTPTGGHSARGGPPPAPYRNGKSTAQATGRPIQFGDLSLVADTFNPANPAFLPLLLKALDMPPNTSVKEMQGFKGGLNEGVWFAQCPNRPELVLKLVRCYRIAPNVLTEAENFRKMQQDHPQIIHDSLVAFPAKILGCIDRAGKKKHDLIVMHRVPGERLAEWIARTWHSSDRPSVLARFEELGGVLAQFHQRYGHVQHGDFQPSNVFYDEATSSFSFIDVGGMGVPTTDNDVEHFVHSLSILSEPYGHSFAAEGRMVFERGYRAASGGAH
mmetsp:Transcript_34970/g.74362  ORF Transcript_34970/g.74362 Transcript_34970/m.74362 type:complete len:766 (+) Transcript_34970:377-2674(+)|eukprot:CAMPEP_0206420216 /NCGR_PEP_ID=MMETSP0324_2-20121206/676_1 /ASSEMBLY_ACC=CAM_ASM_000836 /TAXON_ID=2866 /ORGANISM="Crypthecodinium cohnii, Strain Seligo" /LENGTH=765 /DNA_ID=CAMNT_0053883989 /DNA_START=366 /DNA_END=2663 /DNA_ORIENTATION=-